MKQHVMCVIWQGWALCLFAHPEVSCTQAHRQGETNKRVSCPGPKGKRGAQNWVTFTLYVLSTGPLQVILSRARVKSVSGPGCT